MTTLVERAAPLIATLCLATTLSPESKAQSDYSKYCLGQDHSQSTQLVCALSRKLEIPPTKIGLAMVFASIQMTGTYCKLNFTRAFLDARIKAETDPEIAKASRFLIELYKEKPPPGYNGDDKVFCKIQRETFGPDSQAKFFQ